MQTMDKTLNKQEREFLRLLNKYSQDDTVANTRKLLEFCKGKISEHQPINEALKFFGTDGFWVGSSNNNKKRGIVKRVQDFVDECNQHLQPVYSYYSIGSHI